MYRINTKNPQLICFSDNFGLTKKKGRKKMITIKGAFSEAKIFAKTVDKKAIAQLYSLCSQPFACGAKIRVMPDVHSGISCTIGFTANLGDMVIPNIVGADIGCGMLCVRLGNVEIDYQRLDDIIRANIPFGRAVHEKPVNSFSQLKELHCLGSEKRMNPVLNSLGTLGGGNHFIEIDEDEQGCKYLIIHTGSRGLGVKVATYYQQIAYNETRGYYDLKSKQEQMIIDYRASGKSKKIQEEYIRMRKNFVPKNRDIPDELCYITGEHRKMYLHDMAICQAFACENRKAIANTILMNYYNKSLDEFENFETVHNYIDLEENIVRKGAVSAKKNEILLIPINMRDGALICVGKGNEDWNCSAPHGAGRILSRTSAKETLDIEEYKSQMHGIFSSCVGESTLDESPMAYKNKDEIISQIGETVDVVAQIKPKYNFKAN